MDIRNIKLANLLVNYSCRVKQGDKVLIHFDGESSFPLVHELIKSIHLKGGSAFVRQTNAEIIRTLILGGNSKQHEFSADCMMYEMKGMDAYIGIRASDNAFELADISADKINEYNKITSPVLDFRVNNTKWVILRYPNRAMAQLASTSLENFSNFYYDVCTLDYSKMSSSMDKLVELMNKTDKVRIRGCGTDLSFSISNIPARKCDGRRNIPDGEVYTAPVKDSVNGIISYNCPSEEQGFIFDNIRFEVKNGKIIEAHCNDDDRINRLLDTDDGSRFFGEFAIGLNPYILHPMKDTLFDEKIAGSFHLTPGCAYEDAFNGNKSSIHWDLVNIQRSDYGGGEIYFDDVLIRKDGIFVVTELECLNPENLK